MTSTEDLRNRVTLLLSLALAATGPTSAETASLPGLLDRNAPALVTVQLVLQVKIGGPAGELMGSQQEYETEAVCVIIDPNGMILCSDTVVNGHTRVMQRMMSRMSGPTEVSAIPTQIKVLLADDAKPQPARLLVRDRDLDLAWFQIERAGERRFPYLDFTKSATPAIGETVFAIRRLDRFFGRDPSLLEGRIGGITRTPRRLLVPTGSLETNLGLPVLTPTGQLVGFLVLQLPEESTTGEGGNALSLETMGWSARMQGLSRGVILPAEDVVRATQRATAGPEPTNP